MEQAKFQLPNRPKRANRDLSNYLKPVQLHTNLFEMNLNQNSQINMYVFDISPEIPVDSRSLSDKIFRSGLSKVRDIFGPKVYKRGWNFWALKEVKGLSTVETTCKDEEGNEVNYQMKFKWIKSINLQDAESMEGTGNIITMILNNKIKKSMMDMGYLEIGQNSKFYLKSEMEKFPVQNLGLNVWRGFKTSSILCPNAAYLLIDFSSRVLRQETALNFFDSKEFQNDKEAAEAIKGLSVMSYYGHHRIYRVDDVLLNENPTSTFQDSTGKKWTYINYFKEKYGVQIQVKDQPLLLHKDKKTGKELKLVPELMKMTGLTDRQRQDGRLMQEVAKFTKVNPQDRLGYIRQQAQSLSQNLKKEDIMIKQQIKETIQPGFVLEAPEIKLGKNRTLRPQGGGFDLKQNPVYRPGNLKNWVLIYESKGNRDDDEADAFVDDMIKASQAFGIKVEEPVAFLTVKSNKPQDWIKVLDNDIKSNGAPEFVISLITTKDKSRLYAPLKDYLYKKQGISHQNVVKNSLFKNRMSVLSKILLQINAKLSNPLWVIPRPPEVSDKTMIIGIDIYNKLIAGKKSCIGFVSSVDPYFSEYCSRVIIASPGEDVCKNLSVLVKQALDRYFEYNGKKHLPENIVVYRDGAGEGQISGLINIEVQSILEGFKQVDKNYDPKFAYIIINKKINHRYFVEEDGKRNPQQGRGGKGAPRGGLVNPPSGTILADNVTTSRFDFFLASQNVRSGTCTPTHYICGYNTTTWCEETFWLLSYYQCFNYYNWSGAVKVPAPVQYAHKLSYLVGETFQANPHQDLNLKPFYL